LTIASKPGLGTNVELWLPVSPDAAPPAGKPADVGRPGPMLGTVLLVDDEELVRMSTAHMLVELGFVVAEASSAEEALRIVDGDGLIDVLITDHLMPGMTGVDLAYATRERRPEVSVLVISGFAEMEGIGPDLARLTKPFRQSDLAATLAALRAG
jgi:YesN/AraC family two-component response regulator